MCDERQSTVVGVEDEEKRGRSGEDSWDAGPTWEWSLRQSVQCQPCDGPEGRRWILEEGHPARVAGPGAGEEEEDQGGASTERDRRHPTSAGEKRAEEGGGAGEEWREEGRRERCERRGEGRG